MVEGARLESVYTVKRIEGSNPSLSAKYAKSPLEGLFAYLAEKNGAEDPCFQRRW